MSAISIVNKFVSDVPSTVKRSQSITFYCGLRDFTSLHLRASAGQMRGAMSIVNISKLSSAMFDILYGKTDVFRDGVARH